MLLQYQQTTYLQDLGTILFWLIIVHSRWAVVESGSITNGY